MRTRFMQNKAGIIIIDRKIPNLINTYANFPNSAGTIPTLVKKKTLNSCPWF